MSGPIYDGTLESAKKSAKNWFLEFIRGTDNYNENRNARFNRLQEGHKAGDVSFQMYDRASQENYMEIRLAGEPQFDNSKQVRYIFEHAPFYDAVHPEGFSIRNTGAAMIVFDVYEDDSIDNRYQRDDVDGYGNPIEDDDEYDFDDDDDGDGFDELDF